MTIPAFINPAAGNAAAAREALQAAGNVEIREVEPTNLTKALQDAVREGVDRVIVAGGDGSLATAAGVLAGTEVSLGILPAGTLNHLAKDVGLPTDLVEAARIAVSGRVRLIDVGRAGERIFVNTSSIGAYVVFVRMRERLERRFGYWVSSVIALGRIFFRLQTFGVELELEARRRRYATPLIFVGIGERELKLPKLGGRVPEGKRGLQVIVVEGRTGARLLTLAFAAAARGLRSVSRGPALDAFLVERCRIELPFSTAHIGIDGEIVEVKGPLEYSLWRDALRVIVPLEARLEKDSGQG
jgi:diacylglycerol kinase family enzyme